MPFRLTNPRMTYQLLENTMFRPLTEKMMEVYVDDMLTMSLRAEDHVCDLKRTFDILRKY